MNKVDLPDNATVYAKSNIEDREIRYASPSLKEEV